MVELIGVPEAATRLGVSRQWLLRLCAHGRIRKAKRKGRLWLVPEGELEVLPPPPRPRPPPRPSRTIEIPRAGARKKARRAQKP